MTRQALILANGGDDDAGLVGELLTDDGWSLSTIHREHRGEWPALDGFDLLVLLGSDWSVHWPHLRAEVVAESDLVCAANQREMPILGICYGAQLLSTTLGGTVVPSDSPEVGWYRVASDIDVLAGEWFEWHFDTFRLPTAVAALAGTLGTPQAFNTGRTLAVQFHPEVTTSIVDRWIAGSRSAFPEGLNVDFDAMLAAGIGTEGDRRRRVDLLLRAFMDERVVSSHRDSPRLGTPTHPRVSISR